MSAAKTVRDILRAELARYDDDAYAALANRGLLRRARKDLEKEIPQIVEDTPQSLSLGVGGHRVDFDSRGVAQARCACPASGVCQHILAGALWLQAGPADASAAAPADDPLAALRASLSGFGARELAKHAGKAGYRWAWQFVQDLDPESGVALSGDRNLVISFRHPRLSFRYMGGALDSMLADVDVRQVEKYRVAAVLAFQRAHGVAIEPPDTGADSSGALDLGKDHALVETAPAALAESRARLCAAVQQLARECVTLGLSHFSPGIHERFSTLAVWAQGAQLHRLALLLRRLSDHAEMLLERAGGADEHRLFDELTLAFALTSALESAAARGAAPASLTGRARNEYEDAGQLELLGLGASAWRSPSGYHGLTMLFWSPADRSFYSCSDARPELQRGFDPVARYKAGGPWSGFGGPSLVSGRRVILTGALTSASGRVSASDKITATVMPRDAGFAASLEPFSNWAAIAEMRAASRRSLLSEAQPMKDWVVLRATRFARAGFDAARQTLTWGLIDDAGDTLRAEVAYDKYTAPVIERLERFEGAADDWLVVARLRGGSGNFVAEPLSLVRSRGSADEPAVDSLYFDAAPKAGFASAFARLIRPARAGDAATTSDRVTPGLLVDLRGWLYRQAERGVARDATSGELRHRLERAVSAGFTAFGGAAVDTATDLLRAQYLCLQYGHLLDDSGSSPAQAMT